MAKERRTNAVIRQWTNNKVRIFFVDIPSSNCKLIISQPESRRNTIFNILNDVLDLINLSKNVKIIVDCDLYKELVEDIKAFDSTNSRLMLFRREGVNIKFIIN